MDGVINEPARFTSDAPLNHKIGQAFVATAHAFCRPRQKLWMVANRHLPYEQS